MAEGFSQLSDLMIPHDVLVVGDQRLRIQGLGLSDITFIVRHHNELLGDLYLEIAAAQFTTDPRAAASELLVRSDSLVQMVIACGLGEPDQVAKVNAMPAGVLLDAFDKIVRLTLSNEGGMEKVLEIVTRALVAAANRTQPRPT